MAQTGYTPILIYASGTTGNIPSSSNLTSMSTGAELALNYYDGILFYKDASGNVQTLASKAAASGTFTSLTITNLTSTNETITNQTVTNSQITTLGVGTASSGTSGEIRATNNITAFYSSDIKFKENVQPITNALNIVKEIGADHFDWTDEYINSHGGKDDYFLQKSDFGVIAQKVQKVFPKAVRTRPDGSLAVDYEKLGVLAFPAIIELLNRVEVLENK